MKYRVVAVLFAAVVLGGCTDADWDRTLSYVGLGETPQAAPAQPAETQPAETQPATPAPAEAAAPADDWCIQIAKAAGQEAADQGFDRPTQENRAKVVYQQCARGAGKP